MTRWIYKVHKWIGVGIGLILLMWIVTGLLIGGGGGGGGGRPPAKPDFSRATVSPAAALAVAALGDSGITEVGGVTLDLVAGRLVYRIGGPKGRSLLVDATTGSRVEVGEALAREAAGVIAPQAGIRRVLVLRKHDAGYPRGNLPAWRVVLDDRAETWVQLSNDGATVNSTAEQRGKATLHNLHTFAALRGLHLGSLGIRILFVVASVISIAGVATGYYLSLPKGWRFRGAPKES